MHIAPGRAALKRSSLFAGAYVVLAMLAPHALAGPVEDHLACEAAIAAKEAQSGLPAGLLRAIAQVESGRWNARAGRVAPWPWAVHAEGAGHHLESREEAVLRTRGWLSRGVRSVDVGCMQINLRQHPRAFASLEEAFDPQRNVAYAAEFLHRLHRRHGDWPSAIMRYHSGTPWRGEAYAQRVQRAWTGAPMPAPTAGPVPGNDRVAVLLSPQAMLVQVIRPRAIPRVSRPAALPMRRSP